MNSKRQDDGGEATKRSLRALFEDGFFDSREMRTRIARVIRAARSQERGDVDQRDINPGLEE